MKKIILFFSLFIFFNFIFSKEYKFNKYFIYKTIATNSITFINSKDCTYYMIKYDHNSYALLYDMKLNLTLFFDFESSINDKNEITYEFKYTHEEKTKYYSHVFYEYPNLHMIYYVLEETDSDYTIEILYYTNKRMKKLFGKNIVKGKKLEQNYFYVFRNACNHGFEKQDKIDIDLPILITESYYIKNNELILASELIEVGENYFTINPLITN